MEPGQSLLHFRIVDKIGEGGMGVVWRAVDTTLDREVAIKVLPPTLSRDEERLARFEREAKLLASLNHPHIAAVYGLHEAVPSIPPAGSGLAAGSAPSGQAGSVRFLVMELVSGEDLAQRLIGGRPSIDEVVRTALQVAEALEAAHEHGVIHRDLKPANIRRTTDGNVKVLDFGLAKAFDPTPAHPADPAMSPTLTSAGTVAGTILGTAAYMSPEQAAGQEIDKRCDVWSFGVMLFEMLVGERLFHGETVSHTLADVLRAEIDWSRLPEETPGALRYLLRRCLDRDARRRLRDIGEARILLTDVVTGAHDGADPRQSTDAGVRRAGRLSWLVAAVAIVIAVVSGAGWLLRGAPPEPRVGKFSLNSPYSGSQRQGDGRLIAISPDGRSVVSCGAGGTDDVLYVRRLDEFEAKPINGTNSARLPFFAPDGRWLGFATTAGFWKVNLGGGPPVMLGAFPAFPGSATWAEDGFVYFTSSGELWRIPVAGGDAEVVVDQEAAPDRLRDPWPLPGGRTLVLATGPGSRRPGRLVAYDLTGLEFKELGLQGSDPRYLASGHLLYANGDQALVVAFDAERLEPLGTPVPVLERMLIETGTMQADVASDGTVVYLPQRADSTRELVLVDREGVVEPIVSSPLPFPDSNDPRFSPDGRKVVVTVGGGPVWIVDLESETPTLFSESGFYPVWSPDGTMMVYGSTRNRSFDLYRRTTDLSEPEELLLDRDNNLRAADWAPDGTLVFREEIPNKGMDLFLWRDLEDESTIEPFLTGPDDELSPAVSPDGRWLAYVSSQSGRDEVYATSFPKAGARVQISVAGGTSPTWSPDASELYYFEHNDLIAVRIVASKGLRVLSREKLFSGNFTQYRWQRQYDIHPDGEHFVLVKNPPGGDMEVIVNWFADLRHRLAAQ